MNKYLNHNLTDGECIVARGSVSDTILLPHILLMPVVIGFFTIWKPLTALLATKLIITNKSILATKGLLSPENITIPLESMESVTVSSNLWGRIFNYSTICITTDSKKYYYDYITDAQSFKNALTVQSELYKMDALYKNTEKNIYKMKCN